jgi:hypothetical protein
MPEAKNLEGWRSGHARVQVEARRGWLGPYVVELYTARQHYKDGPIQIRDLGGSEFGTSGDPKTNTCVMFTFLLSESLNVHKA